MGSEQPDEIGDTYDGEEDPEEMEVTFDDFDLGGDEEDTDDLESILEDRRKLRYYTDIRKVRGFPSDERERLARVTETFRFRANSYYLDLIDWEDPTDPIRRLVIPHPEELEDESDLDPCQEHKVTVARGCEHKYDSTALLLVSEVCGAFCRFCFRKRLFLSDNEETSIDIGPGLEYIRKHEEINNVLISGGDPLMLGTGRLDRLLSALRDIDHVKVIRIGTKMPAFNPFRIIDDTKLSKVISKHSHPDRRIYVVCHFDHPRELTSAAMKALRKLRDAGAVLINQTPLVRGINDDPDVLEDLFNRLSFAGAPQYYLFQCRPTRGNGCYSVPLDEGYRIFQEAITRVSGLSKRARYVMSHATGKVEIAGFENGRIYLKYHQAKDPENLGRFFSLPSRPGAMWLDDLLD